MSTRSVSVVVAFVVVTAAAAFLVGCSGSESPQLGPKDGNGLPPTALERVAVDSVAPDFSLRALSGEVVTLSQARGAKNVVLVFYRGHW